MLNLWYKMFNPGLLERICRYFLWIS